MDTYEQLKSKPAAWLFRKAKQCIRLNNDLPYQSPKLPGVWYAADMIHHELCRRWEERIQKYYRGYLTVCEGSPEEDIEWEAKRRARCDVNNPNFEPEQELQEIHLGNYANAIVLSLED